MTWTIDARCGKCSFGVKGAKIPKDKLLCMGKPPQILVIPTPPQMVPGPTPQAPPRMIPPSFELQNARPLVQIEEVACSLFQLREQELPFELPQPPEAERPRGSPILLPRKN